MFGQQRFKKGNKIIGEETLIDNLQLDETLASTIRQIHMSESMVDLVKEDTNKMGCF